MGSARDICSELASVNALGIEPLAPAVVPARVANAIIAAAASDSNLPGHLERLFEFGKKGKELYPEPVST